MYTKLISRKSISAETIAEMFQVFQKYYVDVSFEEFEKDLNEKNLVIMLYEDNKNKKIVGFSTQLREKKVVNGKSITIVFSGDTVLEKQYWGTKDLQKAFIFFLIKSKIRYFWRPLYWFLISKGYKTYMMMVRNVSTSYPRRLVEYPQQVEEVADIFYMNRFGDLYNKLTKIITFKKKTAVKIDFHKLTEREHTNDDIQYFLKLNPKYMDGDELACVAVVSFVNLLSDLKKYFIKL